MRSDFFMTFYLKNYVSFDCLNSMPANKLCLRRKLKVSAAGCFLKYFYKRFVRKKFKRFKGIEK